MIKIFIKVFIFFIVNLALFNMLYLSNVNKVSKSTAYIKPVYSLNNYKYWAKEDGKPYCFPENREELHKDFKNLDKYTGKKVNIIYLQNVDIVDCKDEIQE